jgi:antitoxin MazE
MSICTKREDRMTTTVQKWGNSLAVRLPKPMLDQLGLHEGSEVEVRVDGDHLTIARPARRLTLDDLLAGITPEDAPQELDWGGPSGREAW